MWMGAWDRPMPQTLLSLDASVLRFPLLTSANRRTFSLTRSSILFRGIWNDPFMTG